VNLPVSETGNKNQTVVGKYPEHTAHIIKGIETNTAENEKHAKLIHILLHPENDIL
jgi:RNA polymerase-interacting CarD/CdnL/TRCF family regulator